MKVSRIGCLDLIGLNSIWNHEKATISLDIETTGLNSFTDNLISVALSDGKESWILPADCCHYLTILEAPLVLHNFAFDYKFLYRKGIDITHLDCRDTMLMHHLLDENLPHNLDSIVKDRFADNYKEVFWSTYKTFQDAPQSAQDEYAGKDAYYTLKLYYELLNELKEQGIPDELVREVHNFANALLDTEIQGVNIDLPKIKQLGIDNRLKVLKLEGEMNELCRREIRDIESVLLAREQSKRKTEKGKAGVKAPRFNWGSSQQLQTLLYDKLELPVQFSPTRSPTVDDGALSKLEDSHAIVKLLREQRAEEKVFNAFLSAALEQQRDGVIYPSFNVNGTVTGRISASSPNLQQLPASGGIRSIYVPRPGHSFISADYKQLEVTLAAHFSRDPNLLRVVHDGVSLHDITAEGVGCDRKTAKTLNFAIQYGAGVSKVRKILQCSEEDATQALKRYWATYPGLKALIDKCHRCVDLETPLASPFGRQRRLVASNPEDKWEVAGIKRQAFNSLIQGTGADCTNQAFTQVAKELKDHCEGRALFVVHDEILIEVEDDQVKYWNEQLPRIMADIGWRISLTVPLVAEASGPMKAWLD